MQLLITQTVISDGEKERETERSTLDLLLFFFVRFGLLNGRN